MPAHSSGATAASCAVGMADLQDKPVVDDDLPGVAAQRMSRRLCRRSVVGSDEAVLAVLLQSFVAGMAMLAAADETTHAHGFADAESGDVGTHRGDVTDDFMARDTGIFGPAPFGSNGVEIGMAHPAVGDLDLDVMVARIAPLDVHGFERLVGGVGAVRFDGHPVLLRVARIRRPRLASQSNWDVVHKGSSAQCTLHAMDRPLQHGASVADRQYAPFLMSSHRVWQRASTIRIRAFHRIEARPDGSATGDAPDTGRLRMAARVRAPAAIPGFGARGIRSQRWPLCRHRSRRRHQRNARSARSLLTLAFRAPALRQGFDTLGAASAEGRGLGRSSRSTVATTVARRNRRAGSHPCAADVSGAAGVGVYHRRDDQTSQQARR